MHVQGHAACPPQPSGMDPAHRVEQVRGIHNVVVVVVGVVVVVVVVVVSQTPPAPHTPEQQSVPIAGGKQPWSPSGIQLTHIPTVVSQMDMEQLPHEPPQPCPLVSREPRTAPGVDLGPPAPTAATSRG